MTFNINGKYANAKFRKNMFQNVFKKIKIPTNYCFNISNSGAEVKYEIPILFRKKHAIILNSGFFDEIDTKMPQTTASTIHSLINYPRNAKKNFIHTKETLHLCKKNGKFLNDSIFFESYSAKYMKFLKPCSEERKDWFVSHYKLTMRNLNIGNKYIVLILDNIGGWYYKNKKKDGFLDRISKYVNFIRSIPYFKDERIEIRLHPKNMHDKNIKNAILKKFQNVKINKCDLEKNLGKSYCFFIEHSFTAYYYLWRGGVCFSLENDSFAYSQLYNNCDLERLMDLKKFDDLDKNDFYERRNELLKLCIAHSIVYDGTENDQCRGKIEEFIEE